MLGWLKSFGHWVFSGLDDIKNWVINLFSTVIGYIDDWARGIWNGIQDVWNTAVNLYNQAIGYIVQIYTLVRHVIDVEIAQIESWVSGLWNELYGVIRGVENWVLGLIDQIGRWALSQLNTLYQWVLRNIWDPIWRTLTDAVQWIERYGYWAYYMVTHPEALASLVGQYILREFFNLGRKYSSAIARWLVHTMLSAGEAVGSIIADGIAAIL